MATRIIDLLRHGTPQGGARYRGQIDDPLSEQGWAEMHASVADCCVNGELPWQHIITSPLIRCRAFAEQLQADHWLPVSIEERIREVGFGEWEGHSSDQIRQRWPGAMQDFYHDPVGKRPANAEPLADFRQRVVEGLDAAIQQQQTDGTIHTLMIAHAGVIRAILSHILDMPLAGMYRLNIGSAAVARIRLTQERPPTLMFIQPGKV